MYWEISQMAVDADLSARVRACAVDEGLPNPDQWAFQNMWTLAAQPGWAEAWASADAGGNAQPGRDPGVITDGMILSAVQALAGVPQ